MREVDVLVVWKLDRLGRSFPHLVNTVRDLSDRCISLRVLGEQDAENDTTTSTGPMIFGIFANLAEFEPDLIRERTMAGLTAARARGRKGGRKFALTKAQVRLAQAAKSNRDTSVAALAAELDVKPVSLFRYVEANGNLRDHGRRVLSAYVLICTFLQQTPFCASWPGGRPEGRPEPGGRRQADPTPRNRETIFHGPAHAGGRR